LADTLAQKGVKYVDGDIIADDSYFAFERYGEGWSQDDLVWADGAPVSAPLKWDEVTKKLDPKKYNLRTMPDRLAKVGDLFARIFEERVKLPELK